VRRLEVVAVSDDGTHVLLASAEDATRATHSVRIDGRLHAAVRGKLDDSGRRESELSPKEIQARLRAGEAAEQVAKVAKVPVARVMRYAGPVLSERDRIIDQARAAPLQRPRGPQSTVPLGAVVEKHLFETVGLRADTVAWTARRRDDGAWIVVLSYAARGGARTASWLWQPSERALTSINALATRLGAEDAPRTKRAAAKRTTTKRATAKRGAPKRAAAKRPAPKRTAAKSAAPKRAAAKPTPAKAAPATAPRRAAGKTVAASKPAKSANGRVVMPSWSDVLLGVQAPATARGRRRS
jgi:hypothetical protein